MTTQDKFITLDRLHGGKATIRVSAIHSVVDTDHGQCTVNHGNTYSYALHTRGEVLEKMAVA